MTGNKKIEVKAGLSEVFSTENALPIPQQGNKAKQSTYNFLISNLLSLKQIITNYINYQL